VIVLDTHTLLWWASGDEAQLSAAAAQTIEGELNGGQIMVSSISAWELAMLVARGRVALSMDIEEWLSVVGQIEAVSFIPVDNEIAVKSIELPGEFHKDPADRIIVATARKLAAPLITADEKIRDYPHVRAIW
jgi:PIN domain nuclease of toxin-antitoxin system